MVTVDPMRTIGISDLAVGTPVTGHLSRTLATQTGMTYDWLKSQGLISVRDQ